MHWSIMKLIAIQSQQPTVWDGLHLCMSFSPNPEEIARASFNICLWTYPVSAEPGGDDNLSGLHFQELLPQVPAAPDLLNEGCQVVHALPATLLQIKQLQQQKGSTHQLSTHSTLHDITLHLLAHSSGNMAIWHWDLQSSPPGLDNPLCLTSVCVCVCMHACVCVCSRWGREQGIYQSSCSAKINNCVSDRLQWLSDRFPWTIFTTL